MRIANQNPILSLSFLTLFIFLVTGKGKANDIIGPSFVCPGSVLTYTVSDPGGNASFVWSFPPDVSVVELNGNVVTVIWGISNGNICVTVNQAGNPPVFTCLSVQLPPNPLPTSIDTTICEGDYIAFGGGLVGQAGTYTAQYSDQYGCDSTVLLFLQVIPAPFAEVEKKDATCEKNNGKIEVFIHPDFNPTLIHWNTGLINQTSIENLSPGFYSVTTTDGVCTEDLSFEILDDPFCGVRISGFVYQDDLAQACDEKLVIGGLEKILVELRKGDARSYVYTNANGYYEFLVDTGAYTLRPILPPNKISSCPDNLEKSLNFSETGAYSDKNHFFIAEQEFHDFSVAAVVPRAQPGKNQHYLFEFCNNGNEQGNGRFVFSYDELQTWVQSELTPSINDHVEKKAIWDILNMPAGTCQKFRVEMKLHPDAPVNEPVKGSLSVKPISGSDDVLEDNDLFNWSTPAAPSAGLAFEKRLFSGNDPFSGVIYSKDTTLLYQIRFQNTSADTVQKVVITDTLDQAIDFSTLRVRVASHPYSMEINGKDVVTFTFDNLTIPPATFSMVENVVSLVFEVQLKEEAEYGITIPNTAAVQVDFQQPHKTNQVTTLLSEKNLSYSGFILTEGVKPVKGVKATIAGTGIAPMTSFSNSGGYFSNQELVPSTMYQLSLEKDDDYLNGVTTYDLLQIQKHILAIEYFNSPYKKLAADINNSNTITTADIIELRKLILGLVSQLTDKESWQFVSSDFPWPDLPASEVAELPPFITFNLPGASVQEFFVGVKTGDVSGDADPQGLAGGSSGEGRSNIPAAKWQIENQSFRRGEEVIVPLMLGSCPDLQALQLTLSFDPNILSYQKTTTDQPVPAVGETVLHQANRQNLLCTSWFRQNDFQAALNLPVLFYHFVAREDGRLSDVVRLGNIPTPSLVYRESGEEERLEIQWQQNDLQTEGWFPNPFRSTARLSFSASGAGSAKLQIWRPDGILVQERSITYDPKIKKEIQLNGNTLGAPGVYFWKLLVGDQQKSGRFIFLGN